jgi:DNA-binding HxlR family transcriptional regulator
VDEQRQPTGTRDREAAGADADERDRARRDAPPGGSTTEDQLRACPRLGSAFALFGKRWSAVIVDLLLQRPARFHELARAVPGLSQRVLTERLRELAAAGVVERHVETGSPISVTYSVTPRGRALAPAMEAMREWAVTLADGA